MLTRDQVLAAVKQGRKCRCFDGRDYARLIDFFPVEQWRLFGFRLEPGSPPAPPKPWTREAVVEQLLKDAAFGQAKAEARRGVATSLMLTVVLMWFWILEEDLMNFADEDTDTVSFFRNVRAGFAPAACAA